MNRLTRLCLMIALCALAAADQGPSAAELAAIEKKQLYGRVEELALRRPNEAAAQLRGWLTEES